MHPTDFEREPVDSDDDARAEDRPGPRHALPTRPPTDRLDRLDRLDDLACDWLEANADRFDPLPAEWRSAGDLAVRRKAFGELAVLLHVVERLGGRRLPRLDATFETAVRDPQYAALLRRHPDEVLLYAPAFAVAAARGLLDDAGRAALAAVLADPVVRGTERTPFRALDLWHLGLLAGECDPTVDPAALLRSGCLGRPFDPVGADRMDAYALTHSLLFAHNFGVPHDSLPTVPPTDFDLDDALSGLLLRSLATNDTDLALELLAAAAVERRVAPELAGLVLDWTLAVSDDHVPAPGAVASDPAETDDDHRVWKRDYHTNLVAVLAARLLREAWHGTHDRRGRIPSPPPERVEALLRLGAALAALHEYRLEDGAALLADLAGTSVAAAYRGVLDAAVSYLERQRRPDGTVGFWADERRLYVAGGGTAAEFDRRFVRPASAVCEAALGAVAATPDPEPPDRPDA
jgi:hypothetical protein